MRYGRGTVREKRETKCMHCGTPLVRGSWWKQARCKPCGDKRWRSNAKATRKAMCQQARRYRILMHALGWPEAEFLERLEGLTERVKPCSRSSRYDISSERRA